MIKNALKRETEVHSRIKETKRRRKSQTLKTPISFKNLALPGL